MSLVRDVPSSSASPLLGRAVSALSRAASRQLVPSLCSSFVGADCVASLSVLAHFRSPVTPPFLNIRALLSCSVLHGSICSICHPACLLSVSSDLFSPLLHVVLLHFVPNSPPSTEHFLHSLSRFQTHLLLHVPSLHPMPAQSIFYVNQIGLFHKI